MIQVIIKNLQNEITHGAEFETIELAQNWINEVKPSGAWGKIERVVQDTLLNPVSDEDKAKAILVEDVIGFNDEIIKQYTLPQEFTIEIEDLTVQLQLEKEKQEAIKYLADTDWYIIRELDNGTPCPVEIKQLRAEARLKI
jgi:hypothetical protein